MWQSYEHATAIKADPSYPTFVQERDALASAPIYEIHAHFSANPLRTIQAPVTEIDFYKTTDEKVDPEATPAAVTQEMIRRIVYRKESLQSPGFIANSLGIALEDGTRGVSLGGWRTVEVRSTFLCTAPLLFFRSTLQKNIELFFPFLPCFGFSQDHMRLGTLDEHKIFVEETEEIFKNLTELTVTHVHFKSHNTVSAA